MFSSAICSPIKAVQNAGWKSLPHSPWLLSPFYQSASCWSPVKSLGPKSRIQYQSSVSGVCACCSSRIWDLISLTNVVLYCENNHVFIRWDYLIDNSLDWKLVVQNCSENSSEIAILTAQEKSAGPCYPSTWNNLGEQRLRQSPWKIQLNKYFPHRWAYLLEDTDWFTSIHHTRIKQWKSVVEIAG